MQSLPFFFLFFIFFFCLPASAQQRVSLIILEGEGGWQYGPLDREVRIQAPDPSQPLPSLTITSSNPGVTAQRIPGRNFITISATPDALEGPGETALITVETPSETLTYEVSLRDPTFYSVDRLIADPIRNRVYGLSSFYQVIIVFDTLSRAPVAAIDLSRPAQDMDLKQDGTELVAIDTLSNSALRIDLDSLEVLEEHPLSGFGNNGRENNVQIRYGPHETFYFLGDETRPALRVFDYSSNTLLQTLDGNGVAVDSFSTGSFSGRIEQVLVSPEQNRVLLSARAGAPSAPSLVEFDIDPDGRLSNHRVSFYDFDRFSTPDSTFARGEVSSDGETFFLGNLFFNFDNTTEPLRVFDKTITAATANGAVVSTVDSLRATSNGEELLPFSRSDPNELASIRTFLPDYSQTVSFNQITQGSKLGLMWTSLQPAPGLAAMGVEVEPRSGATLSATPTLRWLPSPGSREYSVYLSRDPGALEPPFTDSTDLVGKTASLELAFERQLATGEYFWRVIDNQGTLSPVYSFSISSVLVAQEEFRFESVVGDPTLADSVSLTGDSEADWSVSATEPWIIFTRDQGAWDQPVEFSIDSSTFPPGEFEAEIEITQDGNQVFIPVFVTLHDLNYTHAETTIADPHLYLVSELDEPFSNAFLIQYETGTDQIVQVRPLSSGISDLSIHPREKAIYVSNQSERLIERYHLETLEKTGEFALTFQNDSVTPESVAAGLEGRIMVYSRLDGHFLLDTESGQVLDTLRHPGAQSGQGVFSNDGLRYFSHRYGQLSSPRLTAYDLAGDTISFSTSLSFSESPDTPEIFLSQDGASLFWRNRFFNLDLEPAGMITDGEILVTASAFGDFYSTTKGFFKREDGNRLIDYPFEANLQAISRDHTKIYLAEGNRLEVVNLEEIDGLNPLVIIPGIPDESVIRGLRPGLTWGSVPSALSYQVYLGRTREAVENANPDSSEYLGQTTNAFWQLTSSSNLQYGESYFWRVDEVGADETKTGTTWSFDILPVDFEEDPLTLFIPNTTTIFQQSFNVAGVSLATWSIAENLPWLTLLKDSGRTGDPVEFEVLPSLIEGDGATGEIFLTSGAQSVSVSLTVNLLDLNITEMRSAEEGPYVIALSEGEAPQNLNFLLRIDGTTGIVTTARPVPSGIVDFDLEDGTGNVYLLNGSTGVVEIRTGSSLAPVRSIELDQGYQHLKVSSAGFLIASSHLSLSLDADSALFDSATGEKLATLPDELRLIEQLDFSREGNLFGTLSPAFRTAIYQVTRSGVTLVRESPTDPLGASSLRNPPYPVLLSDDLETVVWRRESYDGNLEVQRVLQSEAVDLHPSGSLIASRQELVWSRSGGLVTVFPFDSRTRAFAGDGQSLVSYNPATRELSTFDVSHLNPFADRSPQPGYYETTVPASLSIDEVEGATSYELYWSLNGVDFISAGTNPSPSFDLPPAIPELGRIFWRIDAVTGSGTITGSVSDYMVYPTAERSTLLPGSPRSLSVEEGQVAVGGNFGRLYGLSSESPLPRQIFNIGAQEAVSFTGEHVTTTGLRTFTSGEQDSTREKGFVMSERLDEERWAPASFHRTSRTAWNGTLDLTSSGDLLMVSAQDPGDRDIGFIEIYQTLPDLKLEQTLTAADQPATSGQDVMGYRMAAGENFLVTGTRTSPTSTITLSVFQRGTGDSPWSYRDSAVIQTTSGSDYELDTDGNTVAIIHETPEREKRLLVYSLSEEGELAMEGTFPKEFFHPGAIEGEFRNVAVDQNQIAVAFDGARVRRFPSAAIFVIEKINETWVSRFALTKENSPLFGNVTDLSNGKVFGIGPDDLIRFEIGSRSPPRPGFRGLPGLRAVSGRAFTEVLQVVGDPDTRSVEIEEGPAWLNLVEQDGIWQLEGAIPSEPGFDLIRLKISDGDARSAYRTYRLEKLAESPGPTVNLAEQTGPFAEGAGFNLSPEVTGLEPLRFQWFKDGIMIPGRTNRILSINNLELDDSGRYFLQVSDLFGTEQSEVFEVQVNEASREAGDWSTFGNSPAHRGHHPATLGTHRFLPAWEVQLPATSRVNRAVIAEDKVFVTHRDPSDHEFPLGAPAKVFTYDLSTGDPAWEIDLGRSIGVNPPTYHDGRLYVQRNDLRSSEPGSQLLAINAGDGSVIWQSGYRSQNERYEAPVVTDEGIWMQGGEFGGLIGVNLDGTRRFFTNTGQVDGWTPSYENGRLFVWLNGFFSEFNPLNGELVGGKNLGGATTNDSFPTVPALTDRGAVLRAAGWLSLYDFNRERLVWETPVTGGLNSPAVYRDLIYLNAGNEVRVYDLLNGSQVERFPVEAEIVSSQPLLLNDLLLTSSGEETFVLDRNTGELLQTLPAGGELSYSMGYLTVAGATGKLSVFFANDLPDLITTDLGDIIEKIPLETLLRIDHDDENETVSFRKISGPDWLSVNADGGLSGVFGNIEAGPRILVVELDDGILPPVEFPITLNMIAVNDPPVAAGVLTSVTASPAATPIDLEFGEEFSDPDPGDFLVFSITENSNPDLFSNLSVDFDTGTLSMTFAPYQAGQSLVTIRATDQEGVFVEQTITVTLPEIPPAKATQTGEITLNRRTGLFEQRLSVKNDAQRAIGGFNLVVSGLTNGFTLRGLLNQEFNYLQELGPGESVDLVFEYYSPLSRESPTPNIVVTNTLPQVVTPVAESGANPARIEVLQDKTILLEFESVPGTNYQVIYSTDMNTWFASPAVFQAAANRTHWIDRGLPKTNCHPRDCPTRYYRIRELANSD